MSKQLVQEVLGSYTQEIGTGAGKMLRAWTPAELELAEYAAQLEAENGRLRQSILDHENDCAVLPEDCSVTEYVTRLRAELDEARPILESLADMHRIYQAAFDDYLKSCADDGHIDDCLTHGHIRKAAKIVERIGT